MFNRILGYQQVAAVGLPRRSSAGGTAAQMHKRRLRLRLLGAVGAAVVLIAALWVLQSERPSAAQTLSHLSAGERLRRALQALDPGVLDPLRAFEPGYASPCWHRPGGGPLRCLPAFFVLSPHQAGAHSLYAALAAHPRVAADHDAHTQFWSRDDLSMEGYLDALARSAALCEADPRRLIGDASEQALTFYFAQNMRAHRAWTGVVPACVDACARESPEGTAGAAFGECADACWQRGELAHERQARELGLGGRDALTVPLLARGAYGPVALPRLVVLLREPGARLRGAFAAYGHYRARYGGGPGGYLAFAREQVGALAACVAAEQQQQDEQEQRDEQQQQRGAQQQQYQSPPAADAPEHDLPAGPSRAERRCALLFESLGRAHEAVFFHSDQALRGAYAWFLPDWLALWPRGRVLVLRSEDLFEDPATVIASAARFLGLPLAGDGQGSAGDVLALMAAAANATAAARQQQRASDGGGGGGGGRWADAGGSDPLLREAAALVDGFYAPLNARLGALLGLGPVSPWDARVEWPRGGVIVGLPVGAAAAAQQAESADSNSEGTGPASAADLPQPQQQVQQQQQQQV